MKINNKMIGEFILMYFIFILGVLGITHLMIYTYPEEGFFYFICLALIVFPLICEVYQIFYGGIYYEISYVDINKFEKKLHRNMLVLSSAENYAWVYTYKFEEINKLKKIKAIQYYDRKKQPCSFNLLPLQQV